MKYETISMAVPGQITGTASLTAYLLDSVSISPDKLRPGIVVIPGGGYRRCSDRESEPVVMQFLSRGCHCFLLNYSVAPNRFPTSLLELAEAVAYIREHGSQWQVDTDKILVCGFSAGGHLACSLGVMWNREFVYGAIGRTKEQIRPNGMILCYPVISSGEYAHEGSFLQLLGEEADQELRKQVSLELLAGEHTPPAFIWHTFTDDTVPVENSLLLSMALKKQGVNFEMHIYPSGGHGLSLANPETGGTDKNLLDPVCESWMGLLDKWIKNLDFKPY